MSFQRLVVTNQIIFTAFFWQYTLNMRKTEQLFEKVLYLS